MSETIELLDEKEVEMLVRSRPGDATWTQFRIQEDSVFLAGIIAKLEPGETTRIPKNPQVEMCAACFPVNHVGLVPWMARIEGDPNWVFESWINIYASGIESPLEGLTNQKEMYLVLFENSRIPTHFLRIQNDIDWHRISKDTNKHPIWSMSKFDESRESLYQHYPNVDSLWNKLKLQTPRSGSKSWRMFWR